jgi:hypothetical protein
VAADTVELDRVFREIDQAAEPEQVFGEVAGDTDARLRQVRGVYRRLAKVVHPDRHDGAEKAVLAFRRLDTLYARARALIAAGTYGEDRAPTVTIRTKRREYAVSRKVSAGEICDVFECDYGDGFRRAVVKVARHPRDNDLVQAEAATLRRLRKALDDRWLPFLPEPVDLLGWKASGGIVRRGLVLERLDGFYPLDAVVDAHPGGVDPRDMAWVWRRLLAILGAAHEQGVVHGAVVPSSVLIHPGKHGLVLADWSYAVDAGGRPRVVSRRYRSFYPPELADRRLGPEADIFMGARTMLALVGGSSSVPPLSLPAPMRAFFRACALPERSRPDDAWGLQQTFDDVLYRLYGPRKFRPFAMPPS